MSNIPNGFNWSALDAGQQRWLKGLDRQMAARDQKVLGKSFRGVDL